MKRRLLLLAVAALCLSGPRAHSEEPPARLAPAALLKLLPRGAISLRWQQVSARPPVWTHLWCVPRGRSKEREQMLGEGRSGPVRREDIDAGPSVEPSPFAMELFEPRSGAWRKLGSARFEQDKDVREIHTRFLDVRTRRQPVLLLHFGFTHWHEWEVFTLPRGWSGAISHQTFYRSTDSEELYTLPRFDRTRRGRMVIEEVDAREGDVRRGVYSWNGREWADPSQKWLVIGAWGSRHAMQALASKRKLGQARPASEFSRLRPDGWVWLLARYRRESEAREHARMMRGAKIAARVLWAR